MSSTIELAKIGLNDKSRSQRSILAFYIFRVLPQVNKKLNYWRKVAQKIEDRDLRKQALASLDKKAFHCQGGSVYAVNSYASANLIDLIVAYQTICDYLDNLCDRAGVTDERSFITLHQALLDALTPDYTYHNYYEHYVFIQDDIYLYKLVDFCKSAIRKLPSYHVIYDEVMQLAHLYIDLQVKKHLDWSQREEILMEWAEEKGRDFPFIRWQEYAAATGSTLAIFALFRLATELEVTDREVQTIVYAYFPWICGLHILLDYFIDQGEDRIGGDLNFTFYYADSAEMEARLKLFSQTAFTYAQNLPHNIFHQTVVQGLLAMYLSDAKVKREGLSKIRSSWLNDMGAETINVYRLCSLVRKFW
ncbi:MAG TPA: tetraprenyl-beta-curcumene synthase family protein [Syntrophomonadaceae bacterium]|nr:tetraprenyl-beta-curcumene synthase family protein [Syntrophomonadaceae bacterium]